MEKSFHNSNYLETLKTHGYIESRKVYDMSQEGVKRKLYRLLEKPEEIKEERILLKINATWEKMEQVYLVNPVFMSLIIEDYECTEKLLDMGYGVDDRFFETQLYMISQCGDTRLVKEYDISITQWLFAKPEVPQELRQRICEILGSLRPIFEFRYDYWENPFYMDISNYVMDYPYFKVLDEEENDFAMSSSEWESVFEDEEERYDNYRNQNAFGGFGSHSNDFFPEQEYPPTTGFQTIYNMDSELLEGMLDSDSFRVVSGDFTSDVFCKWILELLNYFLASEDLMQIFKFIVAKRRMHFNFNFDINGYKDSTVVLFEIKNYLKILSKIRSVGEYYQEVQVACFEEIVNFWQHIKETIDKKYGFGYVYYAELVETIEKKLKNYVKKWYPTQEYGVEEYMEFILKNYNKDLNKVLILAKMWKMVLKKKWIPDWIDLALIFNDYFGEKEKGKDKDGWVTVNRFAPPNNEQNNKQKDISKVVEIIELLDKVTYEIYSAEEYLEEFSNLMANLVELESEEVLLLCVEKEIIPKRFLSALADTVLHIENIDCTKLMPSIIYMQSQK